MQAEKHDDNSLVLRCTLESRPEAVTSVVLRMRDEVRACDAFSPCDSTWELVIAEVLNNIVEHAYAEDPNGEIRLLLAFEPTCLRAEFVDFGCPMPEGAPPEGAARDLNVKTQDLPEGGFGWFLIRSLTSRLEYTRCDGKNLLSLDIPLSNTEQVSTTEQTVK